MSWVTTKLYLDSVNTAFDTNFESVNKLLKQIGTPVDTTNNATCFDGNFRRLKETVLCSRGSESSWVSLPPKLIDTWPEQSKRLQPLLSAANGWRLDTSYHSSWLYQPKDLSGLVNNTKVETSVTYIRQTGHVYCMIDWRYGSDAQDPGPGISVDESCYREINFFGGFTCKPEDYCPA